MKRAIITGVAVLAAWWSGANLASAQFGVLGQPPIRSHPAVSPYINMGIGGSNALNYYGIVRPQTTGNQALYGLQQGMNTLNPDGSLRSPLAQDNSASQTGLVTGHAATFFNTGHYYPNSPTMGSFGGAGTPALNRGFGPLGSGFGYGSGIGLGGGGLGLGFGGVAPVFSTNPGIGGGGGIGIIQGIR